MSPRQIIDFAYRFIGNFIIVFHLVRNFGNPCPRHRPHIVIPPIYPLTGLAVIWCPSKIRRIDVCGQTLFKTMKLIWPDKVHLTRKRGLIARTAQMVGIGRQARWKLCCVIVDPCYGRQLTRHKGCATWSAQWGSRVAILKPN